MRSKKLLIIIGIGVGVIAAILMFNNLTLTRESHQHTQNSRHRQTPSSSPPPQPMSLSPSEPQSISIPSLKIESTVVPVGVTPSGEMEAPAKAEEVGWYKYGYLPGSIGNAVFAGHRTHIDGKGVFYDLPFIKPASEILVRTKYTTQIFVVTKVQEFEPSRTDILPGLFGKQSTANANLITCTGVWDTEAQQYAKRFVVYTTFKREVPH